MMSLSMYYYVIVPLYIEGSSLGYDYNGCLLRLNEGLLMSL